MGTLPQTLQADRHKFPGLLPDEVLVIRGWLALHEHEYDRFDYNVRIGQGIDPGPGYSAEMRRQNILNTQLRIDAIGYKMGVPTIIEVKRRCTPSNVGQILTYDSVWRKENPNGPAPKMLLVCANYSPHIVPRLNEAGIGLDVVQVDFSALRTLRA